MGSPVKKGDRPKLICYCNAVPRAAVEAAIERGCDSLAKIFDSTTAGVGPCGGSCRPDLAKLLDYYQRYGRFPPLRKATKRR